MNGNFAIHLIPKIQKNICIVYLKSIRNFLFQEKEKCMYMIVFVRIFISAYIKENRILYEGFIEEDLDNFCLKEVEAVDRECDQVK